jgi:alkanesulfonate monooxygenase SsuD/methylene tetrahydromethanopterin reductase-like flavin-dependent oxidoreductase (luciferase family)
MNLVVMLGEGSRRPALTEGSSSLQPPDTLEFFAGLAQAAERAKADSIFIADVFWPELPHRVDGTPYFLEPISLLGALAARTSAIGLIGTASTTFSEPYHVARQFSSIDQLSNGRAGWNIATSSLGQQHFSKEMPSHSDRYRMARDFVDRVRSYWKRWGASSPQESPVLVLAAASDEARDFGGEYVETVATTWQTIEEAQAFRASVRARAEKFGRNPDAVRVIVLVGAIMGETERQAEEVKRELLDRLDLDKGRSALSRRLNGLDVSEMPLDEPIPPELLPESETVEHFGLRSRYELYRRYAVDERWTLRQLIEMEAQFGGNWAPVGTPEQIADQMTEWFTQGACDGFVKHYTDHGNSFDLFMEGVVPILQDRGIFRREYTEPTLRGNMSQ